MNCLERHLCPVSEWRLFCISCRMMTDYKDFAANFAKPPDNLPKQATQDAEQRIVDIFVWLLTDESDRKPVDNLD